MSAFVKVNPSPHCSIGKHASSAHPVMKISQLPSLGSRTACGVLAMYEDAKLTGLYGPAALEEVA